MIEGAVPVARHEHRSAQKPTFSFDTNAGCTSLQASAGST